MLDSWGGLYYKGQIPNEDIVMLTPKNAESENTLAKKTGDASQCVSSKTITNNEPLSPKEFARQAKMIKEIIKENHDVLERLSKT